MDVQISAGRFKGKKIRVPDTAADFRPTKQMVREAICSSLQMETVDAQVLEICAGSGVFSFEMISRGARSATMVEFSDDRIKMIRSIVEVLQIGSQVTVVSGDAKDVLQRLSESFDIIFFDPPYNENELTELIPLAYSLLNPYGILLFEHSTDDLYASRFTAPESCKERSKKYGHTTIRYFRKEE